MAASNVTVFYLDNSSWIVMKLPSVNSIYDIVLIVLLTIVIIVTIVGNVLVCLAVCIVRKLRKPCNYLLVSLAISDLCVAILVMPIALLYEFFDVWIFGTIICDLWVSFDVLSCTASILNLCMISVDRYYAITKPLEYGVKRTPKRMICCVFLVWFGAACISLPPLFILGNEHTVRLENGDTIEQCIVCQNFAYQLYATLGSFYLPLLVMIIVYYKIFQAARKIVLEEKKAQRHLANNYYFPELHLNLVKNDSEANNAKNTDPKKRKYFETNQTNDSSDSCIVNRNLISVTNNNKLIISMNSSTSHKKLRFQLANERKASTTLGIIMSAFVVCWLPFFVLALVRPFLNKRTQIPDYLSSLFLWLGYTNSLLNPVIYATLNRDFRKPFKEILFGRCSNLNKMMREDFYHSQYGDPEQCQSTKFNLEDDDDDYEDDDDYDDDFNLAVRNNNQFVLKESTVANDAAPATIGTSSESFL